MANIDAKRDNNHVPVLLGVTDDANLEVRPLLIDAATGRVKVSISGAGGGDVTGPAGATADDIAVFDGATGKIIKDGGAKISDLATTISVAGKENFHGVQAIGAVTFDNSTHILSVASITYWYQGVSYTSATPITCDIDDSETLTDNTLYYIYFEDASGDLKCDVGGINLKTQVPVCYVMWNGSAGAIMAEWHSHTRDLDWHINAHLTIGARYYSGLSLTAPTIADDASLSITGGTIYDEDLATNITNPQTTMRGWYQVSSGVYTYTDYSLPYIGSSGQPQYLDTDTYTLTNVAANDFVCMWVYASNDTSRPIYIIPTQAATDYNTITLARAETPPSLSGLNISPELKLIYKFIYKGDGQFQESTDYRQSSSLPAGGTAATSASFVSFTPTGNISSTDVQSAIAELDSEKVPAGTDTQVQFNDNGAFGADIGFTYNKTTDTLSLPPNGTIYTPQEIYIESDGDGGGVNLIAGDAVEVDGDGGYLYIASGVSNGVGVGGVVEIYAGDANQTDGTGDGGYISLTSGYGGKNSGDGGYISLDAGGAKGGNSNGGDIILRTGSKSGSGVDGKFMFKPKLQASIYGVLDFDSIATTPKTFTFPNATGTIALTDDLSSYVAKNTYDAHTILQATTDNTPAALTVGEQTVVGRATGGNISALAIDSDLSSVSANDDTIPSAKATKSALDAKAPLASPTFTGTVTLADNCRIDLTLPTADTYCTGNTTDSFASGYSSAVGDLVFFGSGGKWLEVDADAVATCKGLIGIALEAKSDTQAMKVALPGSMVRLDSWNWTVGATLYAGETLGAMQETIPTGADAVIKVVGFAVSADVIFFNPSPDQQVTVA